MTEDMVIGGHAATRLRRLLAENQIILAPRVYDGFNARIALEVGFDCLYITGAGTCASELGQPGLGFATLNDMRNHAEMIANLDPRFPLIADADKGYGGPDMVARIVEQYHHSGVATLRLLRIRSKPSNAAIWGVKRSFSLKFLCLVSTRLLLPGASSNPILAIVSHSPMILLEASLLQFAHVEACLSQDCG